MELKLLYIYDDSGKLVLEMQRVEGNLNHTIAVEDVPKSTYLLRATIGNIIFTQKIIVR